MPRPAEHDRLIDEVTSGFDLASDLGRREAYLRCLEYARERFPDALARNDFVRRVAERLGQVAVLASVAADVVVTRRERLHLAYSAEAGPVLTGNREGLTWLARVLDRLARARTDGEHVRLIPGDPPLFGPSYALTLYVEPDGWFDERLGGPAPPPPEYRPRDVRVEAIRAFRVAGELPPPLLMTRGRVYFVLGVRPLGEEEVWRKEIRADRSRMYVFEFRRDDGALARLGLDLDDEQVEFLAGEDA